jgi:glycosyltransferase involved in cell wall biosynthesis
MGYRNKAREDLQKEKEALDIILVVNDIPTIRSNLHLRFSDLAILATGGDATEISSSKDLVVQKARSDADNHSISYFSTISHSRSKINRPNVSILSINPNRPHTIHINDDNSNSNSNSSSNDDILDVVNLDSGTWPTGGGGVGSCRRDLIDYLDRIRWTAIVEIGGAELVQRDYQIERNITSIRYLPLWDNDFSSPNENVYRDHDYLSLRRKTQATKDSVIQSIFLPMVKLLIQGMVETKFTEDNLDRYEKLFIDFYLYFQKCDWSISWNHKKTQICWLKTWLEYCEKELGKGNSLSVEMPTISDIDMLFSLTTRLLLPITAEIPNISVFHASHHGVQAIIGVVAKALYKSRLIIWDHGILWRERLFGLCYSDTMPRFIQNGFVGLTRLISWLVFSKADYITPCTSIQNVTWEEWLGGKKYNNQRKMIETREKIYPIVNGMNVAKFNPQPERENPTPLAIMLSHISSVKDIHNAIYAANIIVNQMNIRSYKLHIYGSLQKDPNYTSETLNLISSLNLTEHVILKGLGNPSNVLPTGWVFVNSSITEGLPLAIGEAGLCGLPVVCTDVGGSREVVSDLKNNIVYGCIVPPQKPNQLAHAQLRVLCMTDGLKQVVNKKSKDTLTIEELIKKGASAVEARMNDPSIKEQRHELGLLMRKRTIEMFSITRYWRQHEQLLWLGHLSNKREKYMNMFS